METKEDSTDTFLVLQGKSEKPPSAYDVLFAIPREGNIPILTIEEIPRGKIQVNMPKDIAQAVRAKLLTSGFEITS